MHKSHLFDSDRCFFHEIMIMPANEVSYISQVCDICLKTLLNFVQHAHCAFSKSDYNAHRRKTGKKAFIMKNKRTIRQIFRDLIEDGVYAFAMAYAGSKGDYSTVYCMEKKIR